MEDQLIDVHPDRVLDLILQSLEELLNYELAVILKLNDSSHLTVERAAGPLVNDKLKSYKIDLLKRQDLAQILKRNEPHLFDEELEHEDTYVNIVDLPDSHSCLVAPLYVKDYLLGMLTLDNRACGVFSPAIVNFVGTISKLIAVIIAQKDSSIALITRNKDLIEERNFLLRPEESVFSNIYGKSPEWQRVLECIRTVAASDLPVLIQGETGTGKEVVARKIHDLSSRSGKPFITLNCSSLNAGLAESELFGHEKGAFTSAVIRRKGRFELADGGTLFLDEIADLPAEIQPKILRTLQEGTFERVGGEKTLHCDVRVIAASNKDLKEQVGKELFREDLYYRLGVFPLFLPPLRDRGEDVIVIAEQLLNNLRESEAYRHHYFSSDAIESLLSYSWPGNVRELQNVIRRSALMAADGIIRKEHLSPGGGKLPVPGRKDVDVKETPKPDMPFVTMDEAVKQHIEKALKLSDGKIYGSGGAAELLGMKPTTLQSRMKKLGMV